MIQYLRINSDEERSVLVGMYRDMRSVMYSGDIPWRLLKARSAILQVMRRCGDELVSSAKLKRIVLIHLCSYFLVPVTIKSRGRDLGLAVTL